MDKNEIKEKMHAEDFGKLVYVNKLGRKVHCHGKVKHISSKGSVLFYDTDSIEYHVHADKIVSFELKEMFPEVKEYRGSPVVWDGGRLLSTRSNREVDLKR
uniref:Uncharacterized protein n=1 Tax=viral metagenome TaxID=1070528 RepID=A0A6H2A6F6_9ZZZZ